MARRALQAEQQQGQGGRGAEEGGEEPAFGEKLQVVVLGVLDAEADPPRS